MNKTNTKSYMSLKIKKLLLPSVSIVSFLLVSETAMHIFYGYYASGNVLLLVMMGFVAMIRYILILICVGRIAWLARKKQLDKVFGISFIILTAFTVIPKPHFDTVGALLSLSRANPQQVREDARALIEEYPSMTCIGYSNQRFPCNDPVSRGNLPSSIENLHVGNVLIFEDYVLIEKFGLQGTFRGFIVFQKDSDIWVNEKNFNLQEECNTCWKIRIINGLYWYHANPNESPIFTHPLN